MARPGRSSRADAISNSPYVRALIKPIYTIIPSPAPLPTPAPRDLISTQPTHPTAGASTWSVPKLAPPANAGEKKRKRSTSPPAAHDVAAVSAVVAGKQREREVQVNYTADNLPPELNKYWYQRHRLFSRYDEGCQMDLEGWYSVTPELVAVQIAERCRAGVLVDAFCGVGGNAIQFAFTCEKVIAIDTSPVRLACARHNAEIYGVADRITFILADFVAWSTDYVERLTAGTIAAEDQVEVVFLSPPWGGIGYKTVASSPASTVTPTPTTTTTTPLAYPLAALAPLHGAELFALARGITPNVAYYLPRNVDIEEIANLPLQYPSTFHSEPTPLSDSTTTSTALIPTKATEERVEVEEAWMGGKLKAVTCYYGQLATGWNS